MKSTETHEYRLEFTTCAVNEEEARKQFKCFIKTLVEEGKDITQYGHLRVIGTTTILEVESTQKEVE